MAGPTVVSMPPAVKVAGRRLSISSRPKRPPPTEARPDIVPDADADTVADYPRPTGHGPEVGDHVHTHGSHGHAGPLSEPNSAIPLPPSHSPAMAQAQAQHEVVVEGHDDGEVRRERERERYREKDKWQGYEANDQERKAREIMNRKMKAMRNRKEFVGGPGMDQGRIQQPQGKGLLL